MANRITITSKTYVNGRLFNVNEQYEYANKVSKTSGCSCNGSAKETFYYRLSIDGSSYDIPEKNAVLSPDVELGPGSNWEDRLQNIGWTSRIDNFDGLVSKPDPDKIFASAQKVIM